MPQFYVINNPLAGSGRHQEKISKIKSQLTFASWQDTTFAGQATRFAKKLAKDLPDVPSENVILAIGGDGTLNEVLNGLLKFKRHNPIPIAYIPNGSGNDFARAAQLGDANESLSRLAKIRSSQLLTVGKIVGDAPKKQTRYFVNNLGIGFDAAVVSQTNHDKWKARLNKFGLGSLSYLFSVLKVFANQNSFPVTINSGDDYLNFPRVFLLTLFGGGIALLPEAKLTTYGLDLVIAEKMSFVEFLGMFLALKKNGGHLKFKKVHHLKMSQNATIHVRDIQPGQADGEELGNGSYDFQLTFEHYPFWI
ncbi:diacylglycerol/lipid kinase family protein [Leuconostoc pseudomesenteroides]|uniref:diacylglycerol/lipid kinase family protein n=1 Tax=Leuconostoc pseudomesenteroides TaxID=33968 RepID=UPI0039EB5562